ncbi:MAG: betaine/proline/choline family ABC transporter ATP-binding protein [Synergistaceae bacterium]|nr:betaine/proline/choline family ABC transporter ATP-binding protein [Synergistaceae bacterium]
MKDIILEVKNLYKLYGLNKPSALKMLGKKASKSDIFKETGVLTAVQGISFEIERGSVFVLIGLSGSGKSTVIRCINMLQKPTSGEIIFDGKNVEALKRRELHEFRRTKVSMVFQHFGLMSHLSVLDNVAFGLEVRGVPLKERREKARELLNMVELGGFENQKIGSLSGGMKQRVGIARALCNDPDLLLMDEPFSALDPLVRRDMQFELLNIQRKLNKTVLFVTHDVNEAFKLGDKVAIMRDGRIEQISAPEEMCVSPANDYVKDFIHSVDRTKVLTVKHVMSTPTCLIRDNEGPVTAIREMRQAGVSTAYVIGRRSGFRGIVTINDALKAKNEGQMTLEDIIRSAPTVDQNQLISDILETAADTSLPIAALDEYGNLKGIVSRAAIISTLV